jgi:Ketopantoate reductase PanE/ApbA C terminal
MRDLVDECVAVAKADGVTIPGDVDAAVRKIAETVPGQYSSTAQDLARGKRTVLRYQPSPFSPSGKRSPLLRKTSWRRSWSPRKSASRIFKMSVFR